jgi:hypothetical protein
MEKHLNNKIFYIELLMKNKFIRPLLLLLLVIGCTRNKSNDILLKAGKYEFTVSDYDMLKTRTNHQFTDPKQEDKLIDNAYILAFALENRYDTIKLLSKKLMYGMRLYSAEVNGYVWNKKVKPNLKISDDDIKKAYGKRAVEYTIEVIGFPAGTAMDEYMTPGTSLTTENGFYALKKRVAAHPEITNTVLQSVYPFYPFSAYAEKIAHAQKGAVWGPFATPGGFYVLHIAGSKTIKQPAYNVEKPVIEQQLLNIMTERYIRESQKDILHKANPQMHDKAILYMASKFDSRTRQWPEIDEKQVLMDYQFKGRKQSFTAGDLKEFLSCEPVSIGSPSKANDVKEFLKNFLMDIYLYEDAKNMNAETDETFMAFKRYYRNKLFVQHYNEQYIYPQMKITPDEVLKYYNENKNNLKGFESATVTIYKFRDQQSAFNGLVPIKNFYGQKNPNPGSPELPPSNLPGVLSVTGSVTINISDTTNDTNLINAVSESNTGQTLLPQKINGAFCVVYLRNKTGNIPLPYREAKVKIERLLPEKKAQEALDRQIAGLKAKYPLTVNRLQKYNQATTGGELLFPKRAFPPVKTASLNICLIHLIKSTLKTPDQSTILNDRLFLKNYRQVYRMHA